MNIDYNAITSQAEERIAKLKAFADLMHEAQDMLQLANTLRNWLTECHRQSRTLDAEAWKLLPQGVRSMPFEDAARDLKDVISKSSTVNGSRADVGLEHLVFENDPD